MPNHRKWSGPTAPFVLRLLVGASVGLAGCGDNPHAALTVSAGPALSLNACAEGRLAGVVGGSAQSSWAFDGPPRAVIASDGRFRAPSVAVPTRLVARLTARRGSEVVSSSTEVLVDPIPPGSGLAPGMVGDCAPFEYGVASGDPLPDRVILWTRFSPEGPTTDVAVGWEVANDSSFTDVVLRGEATTNSDRDFTVKVDAIGLAPDRFYFYRFFDSLGRSSALGRTRTAPAGEVDHLRFIGASCSSIYSGYFNAYRRIAERDGINAVIHVGDYLYDFVDENERVRIPQPFPEVPQNLAEWRGRHAYYLSDPDLRLARAAHPWLQIWDNHDIEADAPEYNGGVRAFREWTALRDTEAVDSDRIYRRVSFGDLVDVLLIDTLLYRDRDLVPGSSEFSILGTQQFDWFAQELLQSGAAWRVIGSPRLVGTVRIDPGLLGAFIGDNRDVFDPRAWDGYNADRSRLFRLLADGGIRDNLVVSGDSHVSVALDLVDDPASPTNPYNPQTGERSVGVELLPTSISRGNFDEQLSGLANSAPDVFQNIIEGILIDTAERNPHHRYVELTKHGYGLLDVTAERIEAEIWYSPLRAQSDTEELGVRLSVPRGANHWDRP